MSRVLLVTGVPGVGKTTLVRRVAAELEGLRLAGFTTDEIRERGQRVGFRIIPFEGRQRILAHVDFPGRERVGRYGVDLEAIEAVAASALVPDPDVDLYLVDEIGSMECFSAGFVSSMRALLDSHRVLATIARKGGGFIAEVKHRTNAELWEVTLRNRDLLPDRIVGWVRGSR